MASVREDCEGDVRGECANVEYEGDGRGECGRGECGCVREGGEARVQARVEARVQARVRVVVVAARGTRMCLRSIRFQRPRECL